jgi:hypothetical protein
MALQATILRVFIASPGDVTEERDILERVIKEINYTWGKSLPIRLEAISWATHTHPDISTDPQAAINEQIAGDYEVFIGILWTRIGTPTGRSISGTIEEFQRAYERHKSDPNSVKVMFYFRTTPISPDKIDPDQISQIQGFRRALGEEVLYTTYSTLEEFESFIRSHLSLLIQEWGKTWGKTESDTVKKEIEKLPDDEVREEELEYLDEEEGFLDLIEGGVADFEKITQVTEIMTEAGQVLSDRITSRTVELQKAQEAGKDSIALYKRVSNQAAEDLTDYVKRLRNEVPIFSEYVSRALERYGKSAVLLTDFKTDNLDQVNEAMSTVVSFRSSMEQALNSLETLKNSIKASPRLTTKYNRARREAVNVLDALISEYDRAINISYQLDETLKNVYSQLEERNRSDE